MDTVSQFKMEGELSLKVPLRPGFEKCLCDFVLLALVKSGFTNDECDRIVNQVASPLFHNPHPASGNSAAALISVAHGLGHATIKTRVQAFSLFTVEEFKANAS